MKSGNNRTFFLQSIPYLIRLPHILMSLWIASRVPLFSASDYFLLDTFSLLLDFEQLFWTRFKKYISFINCFPPPYDPFINTYISPPPNLLSVLVIKHSCFLPHTFSSFLSTCLLALRFSSTGSGYQLATYPANFAQQTSHSTVWAINTNFSCFENCCHQSIDRPNIYKISSIITA